MAEQPAGEKTEAPTPKRKREARERGQIARTPELGAWAGMLATTVLIQLTVVRGAKALTSMIHQMGNVVSHPDERAAAAFAKDAAGSAVSIAAPMLIGMMVIGVAIGVAQVGFKPTSKKLKPDFSRLNPFKGFKKMVGAQAWWELGKSVLKT